MCWRHNGRGIFNTASLQAGSLVVVGPRENAKGQRRENGTKLHKAELSRVLEISSSLYSRQVRAFLNHGETDSNPFNTAI